MTIKDGQLKRKKLEFDFVSWAVFLATLVVVLLNLITVVYPALLMGTIEGIKYPVDINIFETGIWTYPLLVTNFIVFSMAFLYKKNKLPLPIKKSIKFVFNFEVSSGVAFFVMLILIGSYISFSVGELALQDSLPDFGRYIEPALKNWTLTNFKTTVDYPYFALLLGNVSLSLFGNYTTIPFIVSIALLVLTYLVTVEFSKKRFAGLVAVVIVLQSGIFYTYDTTITYPNFWILFFLLSIYMIYKLWPLSPVSYILSIPSKALTATFFPMLLFWIGRAAIPKRRKIFLLSIYGAIALVGISYFLVAGVTFQAAPEFSYHKFLAGFTAFASQFRLDGLILLFLLPFTFAMFYASRKGVKNADSILFMLLGIFIIAPLLPSITHFTNNPYRWIPFVVFFAIGVGTLLSNKVAKSL